MIGYMMNTCSHYADRSKMLIITTAKDKHAMIKKTLNTLFLALVAGTAFAQGDCGPVETKAPAEEVLKLKIWLSQQKIKAKEDPRGFFYMIEKEGKGEKPTVCNTVDVNYKGTLLGGDVFDQGKNAVFPLSRLVTGWKEGIPLVAPGGSITLYLPPSLAYGAAGGGPIPPNSDLIFYIDLNAVK